MTATDDITLPGVIGAVSFYRLHYLSSYMRTRMTDEMVYMTMTGKYYQIRGECILAHKTRGYFLECVKNSGILQPVIDVINDTTYPW